MVVYCSKRHPNPTDSKFCQHCGEQLAANSTIQPGMILGDRYRVLQELGQGGFGRTYLAEDTNRFNERCVLKEFAPQVQGTQALQKAEELFEREAGVLYQLKHPQIPQFREMFRADLSRGQLFLVQDYVQGQTYRSLLEQRRYQGQTFTEAEVLQLLQQLLPVLQYIHSKGVVHRDIAPDNLMRRDPDGLPVLIDFGGVKQVAVSATSQFVAPVAGLPAQPMTRLGKQGYAPLEQWHSGIVSPQSDLYALGVTMLVLLTGRDPLDLLDAQGQLIPWRSWVNVSPTLAAVLDRMLSPQPSSRYPSAQAVLQDLQSQMPVGSMATQLPASQLQPAAVPPPLSSAQTTPPTSGPTPTLAVAATPQTYPPSSIGPHSASRPWLPLLLFALVTVGAGYGGWWLTNTWLHPNPRQRPPQASATPTNAPTNAPTNSPQPTTQFSSAEQTRKQALQKRWEDLGVNYSFFVKLVNQQFYLDHPELNQRQLSDKPEDADLRQKWDQLADQLLNRLEALSPEARRQLGQYGPSDLDRWVGEANKAYLSSRALFDLADAQFTVWFPQRRQEPAGSQPFRQVWYGLVADRLAAIQSGKALETIVFDRGAYDRQVTGTLQPGEAKAYILSLQKNQPFRLNLQANPSALLSFYPPTPKADPLLQKSTETTWSGQLTQTGYYEIVVMSNTDKPLSYRLDVAADNLTERR